MKKKVFTTRRNVAYRVSTLATIAIILGALLATPLRAQVTIGSLDAAQDFSILELISNNTRGLRLPQLTQAERDLLDGTESDTSTASTAMLAARADFAAEKTGKAEGLRIFNLTTKCVNTWNGTVWIEECYGTGGGGGGTTPVTVPTIDTIACPSVAAIFPAPQPCAPLDNSGKTLPRTNLIWSDSLLTQTENFFS